jgi:hypothetical protein
MPTSRSRATSRWSTRKIDGEHAAGRASAGTPDSGPSRRARGAPGAPHREPRARAIVRAGSRFAPGSSRR